MKITPEIKEKIRQIKIVLSDVDGVLTDGGMYYTEQGIMLKRFFVQDGMGAVLLTRAGLKTGIITTDKTPIGKTRGERLQMDYVYTGIWDKDKSMLEVCEKERVTPEQIAFIGDDVNDLAILKLVGFSAAPADANPKIQAAVDYVCDRAGGKGCYREIADLILDVQAEDQ